MNLFKKFDIYYVVTMLFLFLSAAANFLSASDVFWLLTMLFMIAVAMVKKSFKVKDIKTIALFAIIYLVFVCGRYLITNYFDSDLNLETDYLVSDIIFLFKYIFLSFIFCAILKERAVAYMVKVTVHLTVLSLFFYIFQLLGLGDLIFRLSSAINLPNNIGNPDYTNFLFFSFTKGQHEFRNCGFWWEPGAFACFLIIILLLHLFLNKFKFDRSSIILIIGLITTISTTGYLALLFIFFLAYRYRIPKVNIWVLIMIPLSLIIIINTPNLGDKISKTFDDDMKDSRPHQLKLLEHYSRHAKSQTALNRFSSMIVIYNKFGNDLILGVSNKYNVILNKTDDVNISNGIFDFLAKFGLISFIFLVYKYSKFCLFYVMRWELLIYCILIFLIISTGEPVVYLPYMLTFLFIYLVQSNSIKARPISENE